MNEDWYVVSNLDEVYSPALLVYPDRVRQNVDTMIRYAGGTERLRPHVKTHKMAEVIAMQMGAGIDKFKVATFAEAEMVAAAGAGDILLAYPVVGPNVRRFVQLMEAFPDVRFSCIADDTAAVQGLSDALSSAGKSAEVMLELDNGLHRTGVAPGDDAFAVYEQIAGLPGIEPGGFHVYDGHVKELDLEARIARVETDMKPVYALKERLEAAGYAVPRLICGGTPSFPVHAKATDRECSPGTCVFWDAGYGTKFPDLDFVPAAVLLTRVISKPTPDRLCLDLGYKAVASDNPDPRVKMLQISDAKMVTHNEEHLVMQTSDAGKFRVGEALYALPWHICPTVALHQQVWIVEGGKVTGSWKVAARDRILTV